MRGRTQTCSVQNGRIRVTCSRCNKTRYVAVPGGIRKKNIRCPCGLSTMYTLNHRVFARESAWGKAFILLPNGCECPVYLCDISIGGVGFNIPPQYNRLLATTHDLRIKYRSVGGNAQLRKIRITSLINNRGGAEFLDGKPPSF